MWHGVPFVRQRRPVIGVLRMCWLLWGSFDCVCCPPPPPPTPSGAALLNGALGPGAHTCQRPRHSLRCPLCLHRVREDHRHRPRHRRRFALFLTKTRTRASGGTAGPRAVAWVTFGGAWRSGGAAALGGKGPQRRPQKRLDRRLEEVAKAVRGGYCRLQMPLKPALAVRGTVPGHRLGALERGGGAPDGMSHRGYSPTSNAALGGGGVATGAHTFGGCQSFPQHRSQTRAVRCQGRADKDSLRGPRRRVDERETRSLGAGGGGGLLGKRAQWTGTSVSFRRRKKASSTVAARTTVRDARTSIGRCSTDRGGVFRTVRAQRVHSARTARAQRLHSARTMPMVTVLIPGAPLKTTRLQKRA